MDFVCCLMSLFHGDYFRENKMMENNTEIAAQCVKNFKTGFNLSSVGERNARPFLRCYIILLTKIVYGYM